VRPSYLLDLLDLVVGTGRRITAVLSLRYEDLQLERSPSYPHGAIRWPSETDKEGREMVVPISPVVRDALDRVSGDRPGIGRAYLFPSMTDRSRPLGRHTATAWLKKCQILAGLEPLNNGVWHPFRRMWATERKHLPDVDVAEAGGWKSVEVMKQSYQHADAATKLQVVLGAGELREIQPKSG
jgi:integrase